MLFNETQVTKIIGLSHVSKTMWLFATFKFWKWSLLQPFTIWSKVPNFPKVCLYISFLLRLISFITHPPTIYTTMLQHPTAVRMIVYSYFNSYIVTAYLSIFIVARYKQKSRKWPKKIPPQTSWTLQPSTMLPWMKATTSWQHGGNTPTKL